MADNNIEKQLSPAQEHALKAFQTGYGVSPDTQVDAGALRREALDSEITTLTYDRKDLTLWKDLVQTSRPAESTVQKYVVFDSYGDVGSSRFTPEIGLAPENDPALRQKTVSMKFVSDTRRLSIASQVVTNIADPERVELNAGIVTVAKSIEWASFYGDASLAPEGEEGYEFDGLATLIPERNVMDLRGRDLEERDLNQAATIIGTGYGQPTDAYMPIGVQASFNNNLLDRQRQLVRDNNGNVATGYAVTQFFSARGLINLHGSTVMDLDNILDENYVPRNGLAPQQAKVTATVKTGQKGEFSDVDLATHSYKVVVNSSGSKSLPSEEVTAVVANKDDGVELKIQMTSLYQNRPVSVSVYRKANDGVRQYYLLERISVAEADEDNIITFVDKNQTIPGTADVFVGELHPDVIHLFELLPMMRLDLAQVTSAKQFAVLWYGALALRAPKRWVRIKNVGYLASYR